MEEDSEGALRKGTKDQGCADGMGSPDSASLHSGTHASCPHRQTCRWVGIHAHPSSLLPASTTALLPSLDPHLLRHPFNPSAPYPLHPQPRSWRPAKSLFCLENILFLTCWPLPTSAPPWPFFHRQTS